VLQTTVELWIVYEIVLVSMTSVVEEVGTGTVEMVV
jgi:hypothetical protein